MSDNLNGEMTDKDQESKRNDADKTQPIFEPKELEENDAILNKK